MSFVGWLVGLSGRRLDGDRDDPEKLMVLLDRIEEEDASR